MTLRIEKALYNGNIAATAVNLAKINKPLVYNYHYDQLNRLVNMDAYTGLTSSGFTPPSTAPTAYKEQVTYDPNGNIMTYKRNGDAGRVSMDDMTYSYKPLTNQLDRVVDAAPDAAASDYDKYRDIKQGQATGNYSYDAIGNLTADVSEGLTNIEWNVYGKILSIVKNGSTIAYSYDASGNRISKTANGITTVYVRDASGNVMSIYEKGASTALQQTELHLYGSSRLGMVKEQTVAPIPVNLVAGYDAAIVSVYTRNEKSFELSNHLGNVLVTLSDKKLGLDANNDGAVDYYTADVTSAQDYYPFGMTMPDRQYGASGRYGFNGKENDKETNTQDYGLRIYDPRISKFLSVDPLIGQFAYYSPYQFSGNTPIQAIDLDGGEPKGYKWSNPYVLLHPGTGVTQVASEYDQESLRTGNIGGYSGIINRYAVQDVDKKTYLVYEDAHGTRQWAVEYENGAWKGNINEFKWEAPPNPADALTAMTVGPLTLLPSVTAYGGVVLGYGWQSLVAMHNSVEAAPYLWLLGGGSSVGLVSSSTLVNQTGITSEQNEFLLMQEVYHQSATLYKNGQRPAAIVSGSLNGEMITMTSGGEPSVIAPQLQPSSNQLGGVGAKVNGNTVGCCAEYRVGNSLLLNNPNASPNQVQFSETLLPRTGAVKPPCQNCQTVFPQLKK